MRNMLGAAFTTLVLAVGLCGCDNNSGWSEVSQDDPRLVAAREQARASFPDFLKAFKNRKPTDAFTVEVYYQGTEYIQVRVMKASESEIVGFVESYPAKVSLKKGEQVTISLADMSVLSDWAIYDEEGNKQGGFVSDEYAKLQRGG